MQDPNKDTDWNDALRRHGIIPEKEITEDQIVSLVDDAANKRIERQERKLDDLTLDELELLEDEEDERALLEFRRKRVNEMQQAARTAIFAEIREISAADWVEQVNKAGEGVTVVIHLFSNGIPICAVMDQHLQILARKFSAVKFLRGVAQCCIPKFPESHLPCIMIYRDGKPVEKFIGPEVWGHRPAVETVEWILAKKGNAFETDIENDPRPKTRDILMRQLKGDDYDESTDDW
ncbi:viral IAP-associated factor-like [Tropilaelaps mercedesae]|uniref:Viral IAP-associated factor-like n=1 Tax=Tropilaelaps mercedesae TaxID=418985 RepID=A0A1V9XKZ2_9ACAR|nr:viral IAP-associated factor-like [Tropilaelaps mercedesae]